MVLGSDVEVDWSTSADTVGELGTVAVHLMMPSGVVRLD